MLETRSLVYTYGAGTPFERRALDGVDFSVEKGEFVGIIGHTGSGKSTLIQHLNGLLEPTSGQILLDGKSIWSDKKKLRAVRARVGLVFQYPEYQLFEETVGRDIAFGPRNMGLPDGEIEQRVREAIDFVGLSAAILDASPFELSGGQKRRVAIAGVIAMRPEVLILDEPTAGLDPRGCEEILGHITEYHRHRQSAVILVSHNMEEVARSADRIVVLRASKIEMNGSPHDVFSHADELAAMGLAPPQITRLMHKLVSLGIDVDPAVYSVEAAARELAALRNRRYRPC